MPAFFDGCSLEYRSLTSTGGSTAGRRASEPALIKLKREAEEKHNSSFSSSSPSCSLTASPRPYYYYFGATREDQEVLTSSSTRKKRQVKKFLPPKRRHSIPLALIEGVAVPEKLAAAFLGSSGKQKPFSYTEPLPPSVFKSNLKPKPRILHIPTIYSVISKEAESNDSKMQHLQYNSPMNLYSREAAEEEYNRHATQAPQQVQNTQPQMPLGSGDKRFDPSKSEALKAIRDQDKPQDNQGMNWFDKVAQAEAPKVPPTQQPAWVYDVRSKNDPNFYDKVSQAEAPRVPPDPQPNWANNAQYQQQQRTQQYSQGQQQGYQGQQQGYQGQTPGYQGQNPGYQGQQQRPQGQNPGYQGQQQGYQSQGYQGQQQGYQGQQQRSQGQPQGYQGQQQGYQGQPPDQDYYQDHHPRMVYREAWTDASFPGYEGPLLLGPFQERNPRSETSPEREDPSKPWMGQGNAYLDLQPYQNGAIIYHNGVPVEVQYERIERRRRASLDERQRRWNEPPNFVSPEPPLNDWSSRGQSLGPRYSDIRQRAQSEGRDHRGAAAGASIRGYEMGGMDFIDHSQDPAQYGSYQYEYYDDGHRSRKDERPRLGPEDPDRYPGWRYGLDFNQSPVKGTQADWIYVEPNYRGYWPNKPRQTMKYTADPNEQLNIAHTWDVESTDPVTLVGDTVANMRIYPERILTEEERNRFCAEFAPPEGFKPDHTYAPPPPKEEGPVCLSVSAKDIAKKLQEEGSLAEYTPTAYLIDARGRTTSYHAGFPPQRSQSAGGNKEVNLLTLLTGEALIPIRRYEIPDWAWVSERKHESWQNLYDPRLFRPDYRPITPDWAGISEGKHSSWQRVIDPLLLRPRSRSVTPYWSRKSDQKHEAWQRIWDPRLNRPTFGLGIPPWAGVSEGKHEAWRRIWDPLYDRPAIRPYVPDWVWLSLRKRENLKWTRDPLFNRPQITRNEPNWTRNVDQCRGAYETQTKQVDQRVAQPAQSKVPPQQPPNWAGRSGSAHNQWQQAADQVGGQANGYAGGRGLQPGSQQRGQYSSTQTQGFPGQKTTTTTYTYQSGPGQVQQRPGQVQQDSWTTSRKEPMTQGQRPAPPQKPGQPQGQAQPQQQGGYNQQQQWNRTTFQTQGNAPTQEYQFQERRLERHVTKTEETRIGPQPGQQQQQWGRMQAPQQQQPPQQQRPQPPQQPRQQQQPLQQQQTPQQQRPQQQQPPSQQQRPQQQQPPSQQQRPGQQPPPQQQRPQPPQQQQQRPGQQQNYQVLRNNQQTVQMQQQPQQQRQPQQSQQPQQQLRQQPQQQQQIRTQQQQPPQQQQPNQYQQHQDYNRFYQKETTERVTPQTASRQVTMTTQKPDEFDRLKEMSETLPKGKIANTYADAHGEYTDKDGKNVTYKRELTTSVDPGREYQLLKEEERRVTEESLEPGLISRHITTKYYKKKMVTDTSEGS